MLERQGCFVAANHLAPLPPRWGLNSLSGYEGLTALAMDFRPFGPECGYGFRPFRPECGYGIV
jgi:hypothetical protein